ncbi:hypothetical protein F383_10771 [Gossypium arboreum]|uniref:Uncharacterized protein n=1 Tax=Gossypium arboreum TaxID=29729 RepID=A0A0B0NPV4_GOSAR|nr:hypothetical protein F383_10771 [Gossypium arboreum]
MSGSRVRHTALTHGHVVDRVTQISFDHGQGTRACLVAVWLSQNVCPVLPWP